MNTFASFYFPFPLKAFRPFASVLPGHLLLLLVAGCKQTEVMLRKAADLVANVHLTLGNPSNATTDQVQVKTT